jgi:hypothetical protein
MASQFPLVTAGQGSDTNDVETAKIRHVVELYASGDPAKIREAFYSSANLYFASGQDDLRIIPLDQFLENVTKGIASGQPRSRTTIDFIDRVGTAATVRITELSDRGQATDYMSLVRTGGSWKVVSKTFDFEPKIGASGTTGPDARPLSIPGPCEKSEVRAFDFIVGDWITSTSASAGSQNDLGTGVSHAGKILKGCALWQHRYQEQGGTEMFDADVLWGYDETNKRMRLLIVDDRSHAQVYEGSWENGGWIFYREQPGDAGETILIRVKFEQKSKGFTQTAKLSKDGGKTWETASVTTYEPKL